MGCHTWSYIPVKLPEETITKMKQDFKELYDEMMTLSPKELVERQNQRLREKYPDSKVDTESIIAQYSEQECIESNEWVKEELLKANALERVMNDDFGPFEILISPSDYYNGDDGDSDDIEWHNGQWYVETYAAMDLFRVGKYPEDVFTDSEALIEWLGTRDYVGYYPAGHTNRGLCDELKEKIRKVYAENPGLLIRFG